MTSKGLEDHRRLLKKFILASGQLSGITQQLIANCVSQKPQVVRRNEAALTVPEFLVCVMPNSVCPSTHFFQTNSGISTHRHAF